MEAFDTNVVVRLIVRDDEAQCPQAERAFRAAIDAGGAWVASVVLVEVSWVLRVAYKFDRATIAAALRRLVATKGVQARASPALFPRTSISRPERARLAQIRIETISRTR